MRGSSSSSVKALSVSVVIRPPRLGVAPILGSADPAGVRTADPSSSPRARSERRGLATPPLARAIDGQKATIPSPPAAPATGTSPISERDPLVLTWNSSTIPFPPVWT